MINIKELKDKFFRPKTKEEIDEMLLDSENELKNPQRKSYTHEEVFSNLRGMINDSKL